MAVLPPPYNPTLAAIIASLELSEDKPYEAVGINAGLVGTECGRALWYEHHHVSEAETIGWRTRRIFERGNIEEERLIDLLRGIGCTVTDQQARVYDIGGHVRGKIDGQATGIPEAPVAEHIVECKSFNTKSFKDLKKRGVQESKPLHYATMQFYMQHRGVQRCLYIATDKDTEEVYPERVRYNATFALAQSARMRSIVEASEPPPKLHEDPTAKMAFVCGFCRHRFVCHERAWPRVNCRTCLHSTAHTDGDAHWSCARWSKPLSYDEQQAGCPAHLFIPALVPGTQTDSDAEAEWVEYQLHDGRTWRDGAREEPQHADNHV